MNDNIKGGRGKCDKCGEFHNNVSYHSAHECKDSEWIYDGLHETWSRIENGVRVWYDEKPDDEFISCSKCGRPCKKIDKDKYMRYDGDGWICKNCNWN